MLSFTGSRLSSALSEREGRGIGRRITVLVEQKLFRHYEIASLETNEA